MKWQNLERLPVFEPILGTATSQSGRRGSRLPRPPTPPCVRFRTRRFMKYLEDVAVDPAVTQVQVGQRSVWESLVACVKRRRSTRGHARWWQIARPLLPPGRTSSGSLPACGAFSIGARGCIAVCDVCQVSDVSGSPALLMKKGAAQVLSAPTESSPKIIKIIFSTH